MFQAREAGELPVVAIHGSGSNGRQWSAYRDLLPGSAIFRTPDLLGYGEGLSWVRGHPVSLDMEVDALKKKLAPLERVDLVGHSYGGAVATLYALRNPGAVRTLTVYEPSLFHLLHLTPEADSLFMLITGVARRIGMLELSGRSEDAAQLFMHYWTGDAGVWQSMPVRRREAIRSRMSKVRADFEALFNARFDVRELAATPVKLRLICGSRSPAPTQKVAALFRKALPTADYLRMEGMDHMAPITHADRLAACLFPGLGQKQEMSA